MKPDTEQIIQSLKAGAWEGEKIMELAADRLEELQRESDEARDEVKERTQALLDAAKRIDELRKQREHWFERAKQENEQWLEACAEVQRLKAGATTEESSAVQSTLRTLGKWEEAQDAN